MDKVIVEFKEEVAKESWELAQALSKLVLAIKSHLSDGLHPDDIPDLLKVLMSQEVVAGVQGLDKISEEIKEDSSLVVKAFTIAGAQIMAELMKK